MNFCAFELITKNFCFFFAVPAVIALKSYQRRSKICLNKRWHSIRCTLHGFGYEAILNFVNFRSINCFTYLAKPTILDFALIHFSGNENYETAMASYVSAIITGSEYCTVNIQRHTDDYIIRRMIKCSSNLGCYLQAAILCQVSFFFALFKPSVSNIV